MTDSDIVFAEAFVEELEKRAGARVSESEAALVLDIYSKNAAYRGNTDFKAGFEQEKKALLQQPGELEEEVKNPYMGRGAFDLYGLRLKPRRTFSEWVGGVPKGQGIKQLQFQQARDATHQRRMDERNRAMRSMLPQNIREDYARAEAHKARQKRMAEAQRAHQERLADLDAELKMKTEMRDMRHKHLGKPNPTRYAERWRTSPLA